MECDKTEPVNAEAGMVMEQVKLQRKINVLYASAAMTGLMIGTGIFVSPVSITNQCGSVGLSLVVWGLAGLTTLANALCYTELACMYPKAGGEYNFLSNAVGRIPAFLWIWQSFFVGDPCFIAVLSLTIVNYIIYPIFPGCETMISIKIVINLLVLAAVVTVNCAYVKYVVRLQGCFMALKILALLLIIVGGFIKVGRDGVDKTTFSFENTSTMPGQIAVAFATGIFTYGGWNYTFYLTEEVKKLNTTLWRAVSISIILVTILYLFTNAAYFTAMSTQDMTASEAVALTFASRIFGRPGPVIMSLLVAASALGAMNSLMLGGARLYYVVARDGLFPDIMATLHIKCKTPWIPLFVVSSLSVFYMITGDAVVLIEYMGFIDSFTYAACCSCVLFLRWRQPNKPRPYRVPLFAAIISVFVLTMACFLTLYENPRHNGLGVLLMLSGLPAYYLCVRSKKPEFYTKLMSKVNGLIQKVFMVAREDSSTKEQ